MSSLSTIDWDLVGEYLEAGCSGVEIAAKLGMHENTLYQRCKSDLDKDFVAFKQEKQASGDSILRKVQYEAAIKDKDRAMLIWLGKQRLGQKEKAEQDIKVEGQCKGTVLIHEKLFESRLFFVDGLLEMGARIILCDPHRAVILGSDKLRGAKLASPDIRAGMALLIAALCAEGESEIRNIGQIDRGFSRIEERLRSLGAKIERK